MQHEELHYRILNTLAFSNFRNKTVCATIDMETEISDSHKGILNPFLTDIATPSESTLFSIQDSNNQLSAVLDQIRLNQEISIKENENR